MTVNSDPSRRRHLSLVSSVPNGPSASSGPQHEFPQSPSDFLDPNLEDDLIEFTDNWIKQLRQFARVADQNEFSVLRSANGRYGSADYPEAVLTSVGDLKIFTVDAFETRPSIKSTQAVQFSDEPIFEGISLDEMSQFLKGFQEALTSLEVYSQMQDARARRNCAFVNPDPLAVKFSDLDAEVQIEIAYLLLEDSLDVYRQMREVGFDGSPEFAARNNPALFFSVPQITRAVNFASRDRSVQGYQKAPAGLLPVIIDIEAMLEQPIAKTQELIFGAERLAIEMAKKGNHPTADAKLTVVSVRPEGEFETPIAPTGPDRTQLGRPALELIINPEL